MILYDWHFWVFAMWLFTMQFSEACSGRQKFWWEGEVVIGDGSGEGQLQLQWRITRFAMTGLIMMTQKRYRQKVQYCSTLHHSQDCNAEESGTGIFPPKKLFPHETKTWRWPESIGPTSGILHQIIPRLPPGRCRLRSPGSAASLPREEKPPSF